ncbi:MAG: class I SAM-dependent methyltransferase [Chloroflexi bacterium]|nr:class I SAM-dependent methyltransferase [Chloroflexota bacterium]
MSAFTGERLDPELARGTEILELHLARYRFAADSVGAGRVLDIACGTGYGTNLLAEVADLAIGADISIVAVEHANRAYASTKCGFVQADVLRLGFADGAFDAVVSLETVEHVEDSTRYFAEVARVLGDQGILVISAPNREVHSPGRDTPIHRWHCFEPTLDEFQSLLVSNGFAVQTLLGQISTLGSGAQLQQTRKGRLLPAVVSLGQHVLPRVPDVAQRALLRMLPVVPGVGRLLPSYRRASPGDIVFVKSEVSRATNFLAVCTKLSQ